MRFGTTYHGLTTSNVLEPSTVLPMTLEALVQLVTNSSRIVAVLERPWTMTPVEPVFPVFPVFPRRSR